MRLTSLASRANYTDILLLLLFLGTYFTSVSQDVEKKRWRRWIRERERSIFPSLYSETIFSEKHELPSSLAVNVNFLTQRPTRKNFHFFKVAKHLFKRFSQPLSRSFQVWKISCPWKQDRKKFLSEQVELKTRSEQESIKKEKKRERGVSAYDTELQISSISLPGPLAKCFMLFWRDFIKAWASRRISSLCSWS